jgi:hypothetical protein
MRTSSKIRILEVTEGVYRALVHAIFLYQGRRKENGENMKLINTIVNMFSFLREQHVD